MKKSLQQIVTGVVMTAMVCSSAMTLVAKGMDYEVVIEPQYEDAKGFSDGYAAVKKDGKWGYIDESGNAITDFVYYYAAPFAEGKAIVACGVGWGGIKVSYEMGFVDENGNLSPFYRVTPLGKVDLCNVYGLTENDDIRFHNGYVTFGKGDFGIGTFEMATFDEDGANVDEIIWNDYNVDNDIADTSSEMMIIEEDGKYGYAKLSYELNLPQASEMSAWAYPEVIEAIEKNLVPMYLQNSYFENIKREDFAQLIVSALEEVTGKSGEELLLEKTGIASKDIFNVNTFLDTSDKNVIIANKLGIITGVSDTSFEPNREISRQDAAALLMRAAQLISGDIEEVEPSFADNADIADYAKKAVSYVTTLKIMNGVGEDKFDPTATYTREQAYVTIVRLFNSLVTE